MLNRVIVVMWFVIFGVIGVGIVCMGIVGGIIVEVI